MSYFFTISDEDKQFNIEEDTKRDNTCKNVEEEILYKTAKECKELVDIEDLKKAAQITQRCHDAASEGKSYLNISCATVTITQKLKSLGFELSTTGHKGGELRISWSK
jgi:hypothetical protein